VFEARPSGHFLATSDDELNARLQVLAADLAIADSKIEPTSAAGRRSRKLCRGVVLTVAGILLAASTGGLTLLLCMMGVIDMVDVLEEDFAASRLRTQLRNELERHNALYERIAAEKEHRGWRSRLG
jgi:hypothetical protein